MTVITQNVNIENEDFVLIKDTQGGKTFYGTIPYTEIENGRMKRALNGLQMSIADTIGEAIARRTRDIKLQRLINRETAKGFDIMTAIKNVAGTPEFKAIYR